MQRKYLPLIFLLLLALGAGCAPLYTTDQVNATVSAKIKEVAAYQKINVTVETVILKEYIVVTPTLAPTVPQPLPFNNRHGRDRRFQQRKNDPPERLPPGTAVDLRRLLKSERNIRPDRPFEHEHFQG